MPLVEFAALGQRDNAARHVACILANFINRNAACLSAAASFFKRSVQDLNLTRFPYSDTSSWPFSPSPRGLM
jgi:hypothetical protein